jgi:hypothetical protein
MTEQEIAEYVAKDPESATTRQIEVAVKWWSYRRAAIILSAQKKQREPKGVAAIEKTLTRLATVLNARRPVVDLTTTEE